MIDHDNRICEIEGCTRIGAYYGKIRKRDGVRIRRAKCKIHHAHQYNMKGGYLAYRKEYCENRDSRLGFKCTATIILQGQLSVDHIDGNHNNNDESNLQTLCHNCHNYKTFINEDWKDKGLDILTK